MYIVSSKYIADPTLGKPYQQAHKDWIEKYTKQGIFRFAGPRTDNDGGIIVVDDINRSELDKIISEDAYIEAKLISVDVQEFNAVFRAK